MKIGVQQSIALIYMIMKMSNKKVLTTFVILAVFTAGFYVFSSNTPKQSNGYSAEVFKSPTCGCCKGYAYALEDNGFQVKPTDMDDVGSIKDKYNIPAEMQSCHTTVVGKYFIEGHVPIEAVNKLLKEQPDIDGIALPGMPIGTPGMPGPREGAFIIYQVRDGKYSEFMKM